MAKHEGRAASHEEDVIMFVGKRVLDSGGTRSLEAHFSCMAG